MPAGGGKGKKYADIDSAPEEKARGITINTAAGSALSIQPGAQRTHQSVTRLFCV